MKKIPVNNPFSAPVFYLETTPSTMVDARILASREEPHGSVVAAGVQDAGRGRTANRVWRAEKGQSLLFTILLRYPGGASLPPGITLRAGLALSLAIEDFAPPLKGLVQVKWPNDVMIPLPGSGNAAFGKAAGILTEGDGENLYIGIGVNVRQKEFPADIRNKAASIALALGTAVPVSAPRFRLLEAFLSRFHAELEEPAPRNGDWRERLEERLYMKGRRIRFLPGAAGSGKAVEGILRGIGPGGELLIQDRPGTEPEAFVTGELDIY
jgi:BirA family biotin operon repressor/biotin-[acetyl-CoA-carboxylase] ligase